MAFQKPLKRKYSLERFYAVVFNPRYKSDCQKVRLFDIEERRWNAPGDIMNRAGEKTYVLKKLREYEELKVGKYCASVWGVLNYPVCYNMLHGGEYITEKDIAFFKKYKICSEQFIEDYGSLP